jgi:ribonuclease HI
MDHSSHSTAQADPGLIQTSDPAPDRWPVALYADGGVIDRNPSPLGGTWAWCLVDSLDVRLRTGSGVITPAEARLEDVTNNVTELLAVVRGLEALPDGWRGTVYTDSAVTIRRVFLHAPLRGVPTWLIERLRLQLQRLDLSQSRYVLLSGHPTRDELARGVGRDGRPVSIHNVWCDRACQQAAQQWRQQREARHV